MEVTEQVQSETRENPKPQMKNRHSIYINKGERLFLYNLAYSALARFSFTSACISFLVMICNCAALGCLNECLYLHSTVTEAEWDFI